jgi:hypothetical protein
MPYSGLLPTSGKLEQTAVTQNNFPNAWDEDKVRRVIAHYDEQTDDQALTEDEASVESAETVMTVPHELVSHVRGLIAKYQKR